MNDQPMKRRKKLGEILMEMGLVTEDQIQAALKVQRNEGGLLGAVLLKMQFVSDADIAIALAKQDSIPYIPVDQCEIASRTLKYVDPTFAVRFTCIPIDKIEDTLSLVIADPTQYLVVAELEMKTGFDIQLFVGLEQEIKEAIKRHYKISDKDVLLGGGEGDEFSNG